MNGAPFVTDRTPAVPFWPRETLCSQEALPEENTDEARNGRPVVVTAGAARRSHAAALCRWRLSARPADLRLSQGSPRPYRHLRPYGPRTRQADARRRDLPHLLDVEADHRGRADDAGRRGPDRPRRRRPQPHPRLAGPRRLCQRHAVAAGRRAAELSDDAGP